VNGFAAKIKDVLPFSVFAVNQSCDTIIESLMPFEGNSSVPSPIRRYAKEQFPLTTSVPPVEGNRTDLGYPLLFSSKQDMVNNENTIRRMGKCFMFKINKL